jgi:hypothetical protein
VVARLPMAERIVRRALSIRTWDMGNNTEANRGCRYLIEASSEKVDRRNQAVAHHR